MSRGIIHIQLVDILQSAVNYHFESTIHPISIILVGSNANIKNIDDVFNDNSDLDVIILVDDRHSCQIKEIHKGIHLDISIIKQDDIVSLLTAALEGSPFAGKIFSSLNQNLILKDNNDIGEVFLRTINTLYNIFEKVCIPNHHMNSLFIDNIYANICDLSKKDTLKLFFTYNRLSSHLFEYISKLIYPFHTGGSYRGEVFNNYSLSLKDLISFDNDKSLLEYYSAIESYSKRISSVFNNSFRAIVYSELIENEILLGNISSYFFGYDNLISEVTLLFVEERELSKIGTTINYKRANIKNIVPFFSEYELSKYYNLLSQLSKDYGHLDVSKRKELLYSLIGEFYKMGYEEIINQSLNAIIVHKSLCEVSQENKTISTLDIHKWLTTLNVYLNTHINNSLPQNIGIMLYNCFQYANSSDYKKENEVKIIYLFWGIAKSLRIKIEQIDFH